MCVCLLLSSRVFNYNIPLQTQLYPKTASDRLSLYSAFWELSSKGPYTVLKVTRDSFKGVFLSEEDGYIPMDYWKALLGLSCLGAVSTVGSSGFIGCPSSKWGWPLLSIELGSQCTHGHTLPTRHHCPRFSAEEGDREVTYLVESPDLRSRRQRASAQPRFCKAAFLAR